MSRHTPRSMLGLAMLLVGTGAECASAAPALDKMKRDEAEKRHQFAQHIEGAYGVPYTEAAQKVATLCHTQKGHDQQQSPAVIAAKIKALKTQRRIYGATHDQFNHHGGMVTK